MSEFASFRKHEGGYIYIKKITVTSYWKSIERIESKNVEGVWIGTVGGQHFVDEKLDYVMDMLEDE